MQIACTDQEREVRVRGLRASVSGLYSVHLRTQRLRTVPVCVCVASRLHTSASAIFARTNGYCSVGSLTQPTTAAAPAATTATTLYCNSYCTNRQPPSLVPPPALSPSPSPCPSPQSIQRVACRTSAGQRDLRRWSWPHAGYKIWRALPHAGRLPLWPCLAQRCGEEETPPCDRLKYCSLYRSGPVPAAAAAFSFASAPRAGILTWNTRLMSPRR